MPLSSDAIHYTLHNMLAAHCVFAGYRSYVAIAQLREYESTSEKAAKVLDKARKELDETKRTHTLGVAAVSWLFLLSVSEVRRKPFCR